MATQHSKAAPTEKFYDVIACTDHCHNVENSQNLRNLCFLEPLGPSLFSRLAELLDLFVVERPKKKSAPLPFWPAVISAKSVFGTLLKHNLSQRREPNFGKDGLTS
ncbi:hypothetical protein Y032_0006g3112 [Ancylostoma ceylanicum]|uniref:Uncharacterized protein n=1 Tax=Ancylostoma ceylanicum TaxID=53326 RepID=A0A016VRK5_9BILA|nr:hypothetical protein Y032_0006g3112 [Ancylostoma ceylanicum]